MPTFSFHIKVDNTAKVLSKLKGATRKTAEEIGDAAVKNVQKLAPVDTGALRDSYMKEVIGDNAVRVGSPLDWAAYMELGTGPNYEQPPDWVTNNVQRGHHLTDPWWYLGDDGEWHQGWFVRSQPHLRPAFLDNVDEYIKIFKDNLKNA